MKYKIMQETLDGCHGRSTGRKTGVLNLLRDVFKITRIKKRKTNHYERNKVFIEFEELGLYKFKNSALLK